MRRLLLLSPLCLLVAASTARASPPTDDDLAFDDVREHARPGTAERLRASLLAADAALNDRIRRVGMEHALLDVITHDAVVDVPGQNIAQGRKAAEAALRAAIPTPADATFDRSTYTGNVSHDGFLGYTFGRGTAQLRQPDGSMLSRYTLYITAWRRDGVHWRIEATMWNYSSLQPTDPPPGLAVFQPGDRGTPRWAPRRWNAASALLADRNFADLSVAQGYTVAFTAYVATDGTSVAGPVYWGEDEVVGIAWAGWTPAETLAWTPTISGSTFSGDLAWSTGNAEYTLRNPDGSIAIDSFSKYVTIWARQPDGSWRFLLDGGNGRPAPGP
jgi:ketosteroid isomerase-like protein